MSVITTVSYPCTEYLFVGMAHGSNFIYFASDHTANSRDHRYKSACKCVDVGVLWSKYWKKLKNAITGGTVLISYRLCMPFNRKGPIRSIHVRLNVSKDCESLLSIV